MIVEPDVADCIFRSGEAGDLLGGRSAGDHHGGIKLRNTV